jgi:hypothetical protein
MVRVGWPLLYVGRLYAELVNAVAVRAGIKPAPQQRVARF